MKYSTLSLAVFLILSGLNGLGKVSISPKHMFYASIFVGVFMIVDNLFLKFALKKPRMAKGNLPFRIVRNSNKIV